MEKMYRFTKNAYVLFSDKKIAPKGFAFKHDILKNGYIININGCKIDLLDAIQNGHVEEIIEPIKKPILSEENTNIEEDIYSKKYNIYEILTLIPNLPKDTKFKCSLDDEVLEVSHDGTTLNHVGYSGYRLENTYSLKDILEATYTIVKSVEEVKEKWIKIESEKDLCSAIVKNKTISTGNGCKYSKFDDKIISHLYDLFKRGVYTIEYLEEN